MSDNGCKDSFNVIVTPSILKEILGSLSFDELLDFIFLNHTVITEKRKEGVI